MRTCRVGRKLMACVLFVEIFLQLGCISSPSSSNRLGMKSVPNQDQKLIRALPFDARNWGANQFKPRVLVLMSKMNDSMIPQEWSQRAEREFFYQVNQTGAYVLLTPKEAGLDSKEVMDHGKWDWVKIHQWAREKSIPLVLEWELLPIQIEQQSDSIGVMRERLSKIRVQVKARMMESRKGLDLYSNIGSAQREDKDVLWLTKTEKKISVTDYDNETLELLLRESITALIPGLIAQASKVSWSGRVAMIKGDRIYINVGRQSGLQLGDILKVLDVGDEVFDPETGESIGKVQGRMKGTLEVISYFGNDGSVAVVHSGAGFQENDAIELY